MPKDDNNEPKEVVHEQIPSLEEVNDLTQAKLENEGKEADKDKPVTPADDKPKADEVPEPKEEPKEEPKPEPVPEPSTAPELPEPDLDINKPGKDKVAIKAFDGKTLYFNSLDEVPEDFEPANYKALMAGTKALLKKEDDDAKAERKTKREEEAKTQKARTDAMQESWDKDISELKLEDEAVEEVYSYMEAQLKEGVPVDNFKQAFKAMSYDKLQEEEDKKLSDMKKKRGGQVQAGGTAAPSKPSVREAPPRGVSLDAVHAKVLSEL